MHETFQMLYTLRIIDSTTARWVQTPTMGKAPLSRARPSLVTLEHEVRGQSAAAVDRRR